MTHVSELEAARAEWRTRNDLKMSPPLTLASAEVVLRWYFGDDQNQWRKAGALIPVIVDDALKVWVWSKSAK